MLIFKKMEKEGEGKQGRADEREAENPCGRWLRRNRIRVKEKCLINYKLLEFALWIDVKTKIMSVYHKIYCSYFSRN